MHSAEPINVQIENLYVQNVLQGTWVGTEFTTSASLLWQSFSFEIVYQRRSSETGL